MQLIEVQIDLLLARKPAAKFAGNGLRDERLNPLCYRAKLQLKGSWNEVKRKLKQKYGINR